MHIKITNLIILVALCCNVSGQKIQNNSLLHDFNSNKYFRLNYDNDFFSASDEYYSQGINLEIVLPALQKNPITFLLIKRENDSLRFGLSIEHNAFTPTSIRHSEVLKGDRPFSATLMLNVFSFSENVTTSTSISSAISFGIIGPGAFGEEMQKGIHKWLKNIEPLGWQHQIQNDILLNYSIQYKKNIYYNSFVLINMNGGINAGTGYDNAQAGLQIHLGKIASFPSNSDNNKWQVFIYSNPSINLIGYDATLQGGLFNHSSEYVLSSEQIKRTVLKNEFGIVLQFSKVYLEYYQSFLTKEFTGGYSHRWGGIKMGLGF